MSEPNNRQTTVILPDAPSLLLYSLSLTPLRNFNGLFNYTSPSSQEQADLLQKDLLTMLTRLNERLAARETRLGVSSDATNQETSSNVRTRQTQTNQRQIDRLQLNKDNLRLLTAYWLRTGDYRTAPEVAIQNLRLYELTPLLNDYNAVHPLGDPMDYDDPYRRAAGRFTDEEQRIAENMYWHRTGNLNAFSVPMPDFGIGLVRKNPRGEADAFRQTALNSAESILTGAAVTGALPASISRLPASLGTTWGNIGKGFVRHFVMPEIAALAVEQSAVNALGYSPFESAANWLKGKGWNPYLADFAAYSLNPGYMIGGGVTDNIVKRVASPTLLTAARDLERLFFNNYITSVSGERLISDLNSGYSHKFVPWLLKYIYPFYGKNDIITNLLYFSVNPEHPIFRIPRADWYKSVLTTPTKFNYYIPRTNYGGLVTNALGTAAGIDLINNYDNRPAWMLLPESYLASRVPARYLVLLKIPLMSELLNRQSRGLSLINRLSSKLTKLLKGEYSLLDYPSILRSNYGIPSRDNYVSNLISTMYGESRPTSIPYPVKEQLDNFFLERYGLKPGWDAWFSRLTGNDINRTNLYRDIIALDHGYKNFQDLLYRLNTDYYDTYIQDLLNNNIVFEGRSGNMWYFRDAPTGRYFSYVMTPDGFRRDYPLKYKYHVLNSRRNFGVDISRIPIENLRQMTGKYPNLELSEDSNIFYRNGVPILRINPSTGKVERINEVFLLPESTPLETFDIAGNRLYLGEIKLNNGVLEFPQEYSDILRSNVDLVRNMLGVPDLKLYGSTAAITGARFPHNAHDMEFIATPELFRIIQNNPLFNTAEQKSAGTYTLEIPVGNNGRTQKVDINIVDADPGTGYAVGTRAEELFRLYYPNLYSDAVRERGAGNPFVIPYTPLLLLGNVDPTTKTIMDSFSINPLGNKSKHLLRPFTYIVYADPTVVLQGLHQYGKSLLGENVRFFPMEATLLTDPEVNMLTLRKLDIALSDPELRIIANDPIRMKNLLDYWFITDRTYNRYVRGTWPELLGGKGKGVYDPQYFINSATTWFAPDERIGLTNGLNWRGWGLNLVLEGDSNFNEGYQTLRSLIQPLVNYENTDNLLDLIDEINFKAGFLGPEHLPLIEAAFKDIGITPNKIYSSLLWMPEKQVSNSEGRMGVTSGNALMDISDYVDALLLLGLDIHNILNRMYDYGIRALVSPLAPHLATPHSSYVSLMYNMDPSTTNIGFTPTTPNLMNISLKSRLNRLVLEQLRLSIFYLPNILEKRPDPNKPVFPVYFNNLLLPR